MIKAECPVCAGSLAEVDLIVGLAIVDHIDDDGKIVWSGETIMDWDNQKPQHDPRRFECVDCGRQFTFTSSQFVEIKEN